MRSVNISADALKIIGHPVTDGDSMTAVVRCIFSGDYPDQYYDNGFFDIFQLIADETAHVELKNFAPFNKPMIKGGGESNRENRAELDAIYSFYRDAFQEALRKFKSEFKVM